MVSAVLVETTPSLFLQAQAEYVIVTSMTGVLQFDSSQMKKSAQTIQGVYSGLKESDYPNVQDCGSPLVASTIDFFIEKFTSSLRKSERYSERIATAIDASADDFERTESGNVDAVRLLVNAVIEVIPDE